MQYALGLHQHHPMDQQFLSGGFVREFAQRAEAAGFGSVYWTEHPAPVDDWLQSGGHDAPDPFIALAYAAAATTKLRLFTNLTVLAYRNPFMLAKTAATLDRVSDGRLILGVGAGYLEGEYAALGVPFEERNDRFDETLSLVRGIWSGKTVAHTSDRLHAAGNTSLPTPVQDPLPIWIGGNSALTLRRVAQHAQGWMPLINPRSLGSRRRSAHLENLDDLDGFLTKLRDLRGADGNTSPLDIAFGVFDCGTPGTPSFRPDDYRRGLDALAQRGVTWATVGIVGDTPAEVFRAIDDFGTKIIAKA